MGGLNRHILVSVYFGVFQQTFKWTVSSKERLDHAQVTSIMVSEDTAEDRNLFTPLGSTDAEGNNTI